MVRLHMFVEGRSEQTFADNVLKPHLANHGVFMGKPVLIANSYRYGIVRRGGGNSFAAMQKDIRRRLHQDRGNDAYFTSMIDFYALPRGFPGSVRAQGLTTDPYQQVTELEQSWTDETNDCRFVPHIQLHEYEAYLFANILILSEFYPDKEREIEKLRKTVEHFENPELIDDGPQSAPSKRIVRFVPRYGNDKVTVGVQAVERIGLKTIQSKCPHFTQWLCRLESLGKQGDWSAANQLRPPDV